MKPKLLTMFLAAGLGLALAGCAVYPVVQVAGGAMTGYDAVVMADDYIPRGRVEGGELCANTDKMLERRLRERLRNDGAGVVSAHVVARHAYLIGQLDGRANADAAVRTAKTVEGLRLITCKFYPRVTPVEARNDAVLLHAVSTRLGQTPRLNNADLRVEVIRGNAIIVGSAADSGQKTAALAIAAEVGGIVDVVDYISVMPAAAEVEPRASAPAPHLARN
jgi:osmotically-inducible protein OsmY